MKWFARMLIVVSLLAILVPQSADARIFGRFFGRGGGGSATGAHMEYTPTKYSTEKRFYDGKYSLEDLAQMRADWMAEKRSLDHNIHHYTSAPPFPAGVSEGIGRSMVQDPKRCSTCITGSRVVADCWKRDASGMLYRVRFFK